MFLELTYKTLAGTEKKILININSVCAILPSEGTTDIIIGDEVYRVLESYEAIAKAIYIQDRLVNR